MPSAGAAILPSRPVAAGRIAAGIAGRKIRVGRRDLRQWGRTDHTPVGDGAGFTVIELLIAIVMATVLLALVYGGYRQFNEATVVKKAALALGADVALTRSYAIQRRSNVSLVVDEVSRNVTIRDTSGAILALRSFDLTSALPLERIDVKTVGDSLTFNSRGLLTAGAGIEIDLGKGERDRTLSVNALGRYQLSNTN